MSETPVELEPQLSVQSLSQPEPERGLQSLPLFQLPLPTQDPHQLQQQSQLQPELQQQQLLESNLEHQAKPGWIKHQRLLLFLLGFFFFTAILGLIFYMQHNLHTESSHNAVMPCVTPACQWASSYLSTSTDPFTQPCDYFLFTCGSDRLSSESGGRQRGQGIPGHPQNQKEKRLKEQRDRRRPTQDKILSRKTVLLQYLRKILETNDSSGSSAVQKTKEFYHSCLDTKSIETAGIEPFLTLIQKLGGWAVSGQWNKTDFNSTLGLLMRDYATFPFFNLYVGKDPNETAHGMTKRYIQIDQPDLLIPIEWNSKTQKSEAKTETLRPFLASCQRYLALLGSPQSRSMIHVGMFISLSSELAVAASPLHYRLLKGQLHQRMTIKELQKQAPAIDWLGCLQIAFHPLSLSEDDYVLLHNLPYIIQMSHIINKWLNTHELSSTSGSLHTYMVLNLLHTMMPAMDARFSETAKNFSLALGNAAEEVPRWKRCVLDTERGFDSVLTHLLSQRTAHREAEKIIENVFAAFKSQLHELKWTDRKSFRLVMKKVYSLIPKLWTTEEISGEDELDLPFSKVTVSTQSFFSNYIQLLSLWQKRRSKLLKAQKEAADILSVTPLLLGNELLFPMGMFIPPIFHPTYPKAMNYGAAGFLIAKDIFHLLIPEIYSHSETVHAVGECVWTHYINVTEKAGRDGVSWISAKQQQEVWVQYSALQVSLQAYHQSLSQDPSDTSLSGLSHTRLLLTSFSQVNCDADPYHHSMPLEPSFLIAVICAKSNLCPISLQCSIKPQENSSQTC
ncbi:kell blood group glycoprotein [Melanotaenia boesemani]|uniref:kell blood group glycoprotein n=1 Tax=Melanotaenia boesemani TaxID=1250792 RepID=UPI001C057662|nr:kell blood group glycoprotein [Melanotaenia boesemani]